MMNSVKVTGFDKFASGEPNGEPSFCVVVRSSLHSDTHHWDDQSCAEKKAFICELSDISPSIYYN